MITFEKRLGIGYFRPAYPIHCINYAAGYIGKAKLSFYEPFNSDFVSRIICDGRSTADSERPVGERQRGETLRIGLEEGQS